jgi:hypothetical protein
MMSFDKTNEGTNSKVVSFLLDIGTFVERLWNVCFFIVLPGRRVSFQKGGLPELWWLNRT